MRTMLEVALPVFAVMLCGYLAGRSGMVANSGVRSLNNYVYYFALPALLFLSLAQAPVDRLVNWPFLAANLGGIVAGFAVSAAFAWVALGRGLPTPALHGMVGSFGNTGYMGVPLLIAAFGPEAAVPAAMATVVHNVPVTAAVILTYECSKVSGEAGKKGGRRIGGLLLDVARAVLLNPIVLSVAAGAGAAVSGFELPESVGVFAGLLKDAAGPTALFALGLGLVGARGVSGADIGRIEIASPVASKLVLQPLMAALLAFWVFNLDGLWATVTVLMSALPVGATPYVFAQRYGDSVDMASLAVLVSTLISVVTVSALLAVVSGGTLP
jgi:malonate transporter